MDKRNRCSDRSVICAFVLLLLCGDVQAADPAIEFNRDIRPILSDACFHCHGPDKAKRQANLRLDTEEGAFADLGGSRAFVAGNLDDSEAYQRITCDSDDDQLMPPKRSGRVLNPVQRDLLARWIKSGAKYEPHWSFVAPKKSVVPDVRGNKWVRNPIDAFLLSRMEAEGIAPAPEADKVTLLRRISLDLTGLPPTPEEVDAFLADSDADAYEKVVDRLLASPRYGERMTLDWLDAARYADTNGYQGDRTRTLWPWRDWVIEAFNANMPFDKFIVEQIAGDLLTSPTTDQRIATGFHRNHMLNGEGGRIPEESRVDYVVDRVDTTATVFLGLTLACSRCHDHKYDPFSQKEYYQLYAYFNNIDESGSVDRGGNAAPVLALPTPSQATKQTELNQQVAELDGQVNALAKTLDIQQPIWEENLRATLAAPVAKVAVLAKVPIEKLTDVQKKERDEALVKITVADNLIEGLLTPGDRRSGEIKKLLLDAHRASSPDYVTIVKTRDASKKSLTDLNNAIVQTMVMQEKTPPRESFLLVRGAYDQYGEKVTAATPSKLPTPPSDAPANRLGLAKWLISPENPLTARVKVNRDWQMFFGVGIVKTVEDLGVQGEPPFHPALLDWLATNFVESGWNVKTLHRLMVTSAVYRQSSRVSPPQIERDPDNRFVARGSRLRLSSLVLRDQALFASGLVVEKVGGPAVFPYQPPGIWEEMSFNQIKYTQGHGEDLYRRSLYTFWRRTVGPTDLFDTSARQTCTVKAVRTNTPLQSLILMNDVTYLEAARNLAQRVMLKGESPNDRIVLAFRLATSRKPTAAESEVLNRALAKYLDHYKTRSSDAIKLISQGESQRDERIDPTEFAAYTALANLILNLDETITKE